MLLKKNTMIVEKTRKSLNVGKYMFLSFQHKQLNSFKMLNLGTTKKWRVYFD